MNTFSTLNRLLKIHLYLLPLLAGLPVFAQNLVQNGTFNNTTANWTFFAPGTATETIYFEATYGGVSATNHVAEIDYECNLRQSNITVIPGKSYTLSFRHSRRTGNGVAPNPTAIKIDIYDPTANIGSYLSQSVYSYNTTWDWQCESFNFIPLTSNLTLDIGNIVAYGQSPSTLGTIMDDITITPTEQSLASAGASCPGGSFTLTAPSFPGDANTSYTGYSWSGPNGFTDSNQSITLSDLHLSDNGFYSCSMTVNGCAIVTASIIVDVIQPYYQIEREVCEGATYNFYGRQLYKAGMYDTVIPSITTACDSLIELKLTVHPVPSVKLSPDKAVTICAGDTALISVPDAAGGIHYQWLQQSRVLNGETGPVFRTTQEGIYRLAATSDKGCTDTSDEVKVTVSLPPAAEIVMEPAEKICLSDTILLRSGTEAAHYLWEPEADFRYTSVFDAREGKAILKDKQTEVVLTIFDANGCRNADTLEVVAVSCCRILVPNAFSPNGDGVNDWFLPMLRHNQAIIAFRVFDRWGKNVYDLTSGNRKGWNGSYPSGKEAVAGTYMYQLEYTCDDGSTKTAKGDVTLIR